jgi:hypothetical protein
MDDRASALECRLDVIGQMGEIGGKDRGCQFDQNISLSKVRETCGNSSKEGAWQAVNSQGKWSLFLHKRHREIP